MKATPTKRKPVALKVHADIYERLTKFCEDHSIVPKNTIYNKALAFYLEYAERGVDFNLNPVGTLNPEGKRR